MDGNGLLKDIGLDKHLFEGLFAKNNLKYQPEIEMYVPSVNVNPLDSIDSIKQFYKNVKQSKTRVKKA